MNGFVQADSVLASERALRQDQFTLTGVEDWAAEIRSCFERRGTHTLDLARLIHSAKRTLHRGQWTQLCRSGQLPFSQRKAEMLASVGKGLGDLNAQTFARLPAGWSILYCLARLPGEMLLSLIADGSIHPALTLAQAKALLTRFRGHAAVESSERSKVRRRLRSFQQFVCANWHGWTAAERQLLRTSLQELLVTLSEPVILAVVPSAPSRTFKVNS